MSARSVTGSANPTGAHIASAAGDSDRPDPATDGELAVLVLQVSWALADAAHDLPAGRVSAQRREELGDTLGALGFILRASECPVSAEEPRSGSAAAQELEALRAALRCGATAPVPMHLTELEETLTQRHHWRTPTVLCGADVTDAEPDDADPEDCPGCADCVVYCSGCVAEAARFATAETPANGSQRDAGPDVSLPPATAEPYVRDRHGKPIDVQPDVAERDEREIETLQSYSTQEDPS